MPAFISSLSVSNVVAGILETKSAASALASPVSVLPTAEDASVGPSSGNFVDLEPKILFITEYIVSDEYVGLLIVWEKYFNATHYEVFKRNVFGFKSDFERILFLDSNSLSEERAHYMDYINNVLGFSSVSESDVYIVLDTFVKQDRIYEYKIKANFLPQKASDVDFAASLRGRDLLRSTEIGAGSQNIFSFSEAVLGNKDLAWILSMSNVNLGFFDRNFSEKPLNEILKDKFMLVPKDTNDIMKMINDSIILFGMKQAFSGILTFLKGLSQDVLVIAVNSIDEEKGTFSFDKFKNDIQDVSLVFKLILSSSVSEKSSELSKISIVVPQDTGSSSISSLENMTKVLNFINKFIIAASYSQDNFDAVKTIIQSVNQETTNKQTPLEKVSSLLGDVLKTKT